MLDFVCIIMFFNLFVPIPLSFMIADNEDSIFLKVLFLISMILYFLAFYYFIYIL